MLKVTMFFWLFCLSVCHGYRLLGIFPFHGKSHFVMPEALMKGLAKKGHQVDVISTFPLKKPYPNYNDVVKLKAPMALVNNISYEFAQLLFRTGLTFSVATIAGNDACKVHLGNPAVKELARNPPKNPPYDAVLMEVRK